MPFNLNPARMEQAYVALAACPTHACHSRYDADAFIKPLVESRPARENHSQLESLPVQAGG